MDNYAGSENYRLNDEEILKRFANFDSTTRARAVAGVLEKELSASLSNLGVEEVPSLIGELLGYKVTQTVQIEPPIVTGIRVPFTRKVLFRRVVTERSEELAYVSTSANLLVLADDIRVVSAAEKIASKVKIDVSYNF